MKMRRHTAAVMLLLGLPAAASAELRQVTIDVPGMDCASCARAMSAAVKKIDGVESVDLSVEKSSVEIRLRAENRVTLDRIRREIRAFGYPTRDATITAKGTVVERDGKPAFDLLNGSTLVLAVRPEPAPAGVVNITGVSKLQEPSGERLTITSVK